MRSAETCIAPFDDEDGTIKFHWPHYSEMKGKMVEVVPIIQPQIPKSTEVVLWQAVEQGAIVWIKVIPCFHFSLITV